MNDFIKPKPFGRVREVLKSFGIGAAVLGVPTLLGLFAPKVLISCFGVLFLVTASLFVGAVVRAIIKDFKE